MVPSRPAALSINRPSRSPFAADAAPIYLFLVLACALMPLALAATGLQIAVDEFGMVAGIFLFALWFAWCLRGRGLERIATALEAWILFYTVSIVLCLMTFVAGTSGRAYFDAPLAHADHILLPGFDWPSAMLSFSGSGLPVQMANRVYESIGWQPQALIVTLALLSAHRRIWHFVLSWITTLCFVVAIFALYPVVGAYQHFGITAADVPAMLNSTPWNQPALLEGLRNGTLGRISLVTLDGIVNYPSFHAGAAVLLAYGFWQIRIMRWPFAILNMLMFAAAVPIGGHYVIDLIAGAITAMAGIAAATRIMNRVNEPWFIRRRRPPAVPAAAS